MTKNSEFVQSFRLRTLRYSVRIISFCDKLPKILSAQVIAKQLLRSATSIGANFVEAQATNSRKEFLNYLSIALKSANETEYWLTLLLEAQIGYQTEEKLLTQETRELGNILGSILKKLRK